MNQLLEDEVIARMIARLEAMVMDDKKTLEELEAESIAEEQRRKEERRAMEERDALLCGGFPRRAIDCLDEVTGQEWQMTLKRVYRHALTPGSIIVLNGRYGTGKTVMATYIARLLRRRKKASKYSKTYDFTMDLRETFNGGKESESSVMTRYRRPYLLVLDEYHEVKDSDFTGPALERLIDYRHQNGKVTVIIANYKPSELEAHLGQAIVSRIHLSGEIVTCDWMSYRERREA